MNQKSESKYSKIIRNRQQRIERRLGKKQWEDQPKPIMKGSNIHYEMSEKTHAIKCVKIWFKILTNSADGKSLPPLNLRHYF